MSLTYTTRDYLEWIFDGLYNILKEGKYEIQRAAFAEEVIFPHQFPDLKIRVEDVLEGIGDFE